MKWLASNSYSSSAAKLKIAGAYYSLLQRLCHLILLIVWAHWVGSYLYIKWNKWSSLGWFNETVPQVETIFKNQIQNWQELKFWAIKIAKKPKFDHSAMSKIHQNWNSGYLNLTENDNYTILKGLFWLQVLKRKFREINFLVLFTASNSVCNYCPYVAHVSWKSGFILIAAAFIFWWQQKDHPWIRSIYINFSSTQFQGLKW